MRPVPNLKLSRTEADRLIQIQMERGKALSPGDISKSAVEKAADLVDEWEKETCELLASIVDSREFADEFDRAATLYQRGGDLKQMLAYSSARITYKNYALDEIRSKLKLFAEPEPETSASEFWDLMNPTIVGLSRKKFEDGHRADAVETALKHVNLKVKEIVRKRTGNELDGASLMKTAFSLKAPIISLADLSTESGRNIQLGYMEIFAGAMTGIRNPKAHENFTTDENRAIHLLFLASLLLTKVEEAI